MRISGCLTASISLGALFGVTALCAFTSFSLTQQTVVDLSTSGFGVDEPLETLRCAVTGQCSGDQTPVDVDSENAPLLVLTPHVTVTPAAIPTVRTAATVAPTVVKPVARATAIPTTAATNIPVKSNLPRITDPRQMHILLLGIDQRSATDDDGPFRTDTMILLSVSPARKSVGVLSLPRDLWVNIPGFGPSRINTANSIGDANAYPGGGGPALAMETIAENFGVRVEKYLLVNFDVFTTIVDTLAPNGVLVNVSEFIDDPDYPDAHYGTMHVQFQPGEQRMPAEKLLQYARTRATEGGDFDRARRQQVVLDAVRAEVLSAGGIINFISQAPVLWAELQGNYRTNLELNDILALGHLMGEIKREDIRYRVVDNLYAIPGLSPQGDQILYPDFTSIRDLILNTFYSQTQLTLADLKAHAEAEAAPIYVYNGTNLPGLAGATREWLLAKGVLVSGINNDVTVGRKLTEISEYGRYNWTARYLARLLGLPEDRIGQSGDGRIAAGVLVALGEDALAIIGG